MKNLLELLSNNFFVNSSWLSFENLVFLFLALIFIAAILLFFISIAGPAISNFSFNPKYYIDLGMGEPWFNEYEQSGLELDEFLGLDRNNRMKIKVVIDKIGTYTSPGGKRYVAIANYTDANCGKKIVFYFPMGAIDPEIGYDSDSCGIIGVKFSIWVDKHNYSKYSSIVY